MRAIWILAVLALAGCDQPAPPPAAVEPAVMHESSERRALTGLLKTEQVERLRRLTVTAKIYRDAIDGLLGDPQEERLATAREAWTQLYRGFNEAVVVLACRASEDSQLAGLLQQVDVFPILPGYIDGLKQWPDSGIVHDVSLPLTRDSLREQQAMTAQEEASLGFQVVAFLLYGEPGSPRLLADLSATSYSEDNDLAEQDQPANRRRAYLHLASELLVEDVLQLASNPYELPLIGQHCPMDSLRRATERLIRVIGLAEHTEVAGDYFAEHSRQVAMAGLHQALQPWLQESSPLHEWAKVEAGVSRLPALPPATEVDILALQQLHAALRSGRSPRG
jgi:hypothetical protein